MKIKSKNVLIDGKFIKACVYLNQGYINKILPYECDAIDYGNDYIVPGFIDIHTHGGYGLSFMDHDINAIKHLKKKYASEGTTSFLATSTSLPIDELKENLNYISEVIDTQCIDGSSKIIGIHLEGPFINEQYAGSQRKDCLKIPTICLLNELNNACKGNIKRVTLASELDHNHEVIKYASKNKIIVSNGHSNASFEEANLAIKDGSSLITHFYNGMPEFAHRNPGIVGAGLLSKDVYAEVIADGYHVDFSAIELLYNSIGKDYVILITDANMAKGLSEGLYEFNGRKVRVDKKGISRLESTGSLAGSTVSLNVCLKNIVEKTKIPLEEAIGFITRNPAKLLNLKKVGELKEGYKADLTIINEKFEIVNTIIEGVGKE